MSWLFSRALVGEFSAAISWDGEPYAQSSATSMPQVFLSPDRTTDISRLSRFGMTCGPLMEGPGAESLTWFLGAFPVRTSVLPEKAPGSPASDLDSGEKWRGWSAKYDPDSSTWKTAQCSFIEDLESSSATFPPSGMTRDGTLWELPTLAPLIGETESGLWPTPTASTGGPEPEGKTGRKLITAAQMWPTPIRNDAEKRGDLRKYPQYLGGAAQIATYPTPRSSGTTMGGGSNARVAAKLRGDLVLGSLNPPWVEWLMGWPIGWTDLKPLETAKFQEWQQQHSPS